MCEFGRIRFYNPFDGITQRSLNIIEIGTLLKQDNSIACHQFIIISRSRNSLFLQILLFISAKLESIFQNYHLHGILRPCIDLGKENGAIDEEETEWLQNVFEFNDTPVQEAMTRDFEVESFQIGDIITMEDLLEEIVGNIYDEFDAEEEPEIEQMDDNLWRFPGSTLIRDVSETLGMTLPEQEDYETVGGLVLSCLNTIPADGTTLDVETEGLSIHVEQIKNRRIESVLVKKLEQKQEEDEVRKTG